jgi:hypothetical protein
VADDAILRPKGKDLFEQLIAGHDYRDLFRDIRMQASHSPVDPRSISLIKNLQEKKIPTLALTAAPAKIQDVEQPCDWRINELKRYGFDFSYSFAERGFLEFSKDPGQTHYPMYKSGVLFSSFHPKGDILVAFLQKMGLSPKKVIFVDDEFRHVQSVVTSLEKLGISVLGIHYTAANEAPCALDITQATFQMNHFLNHDIWLSDDDSKLLLNSL